MHNLWFGAQWLTKTCQKSSWYHYIFTLVCCFSVCLSRGLFCFLRFLPELVSFPFLVLFSVSSLHLTFLPVVLTVIFPQNIYSLNKLLAKCSWATLQVVKTKSVEKAWHDNRASLFYAAGLWCSRKYSYGLPALIFSTHLHVITPFFLSIHLYLSVSISFHITPLSFIKMQTHAL